MERKIILERTELRVGQIINYCSGGSWKLQVVTGFCTGHTILNSDKPKEEWRLESIFGGSISDLPIEATEHADLNFDEIVGMFNRSTKLSEAEIAHLKKNFNQ